MPRFTLNTLFTPWTSAATAPSHPGWYRIRTEPLTHSWWNGMGYFDGQGWSEFGQHAGLRVRQDLRVLQWQGLNRPVAQAIATIRENLPKSSAARRRHLTFLAQLEATPTGAR